MMATIAAQVSLYPLRREQLGPAITEAIAAFRRHEVTVWEGPMSTVIAGEPDSVWDALRAAFTGATARGEAVMVVTVSNGCPVPTATD
jgi:uncharacterized protein YqgV (UPF0045/DUF77 family)